MAGLIHGIRGQKPSQYIIDFAASAAFGKLFEEGDATRQRIEEVEERFMA
jgi:2-dehydro-3-deoxygluconokinase